MMFVLYMLLIILLIRLSRCLTICFFVGSGIGIGAVFGVVFGYIMDEVFFYDHETRDLLYSYAYADLKKYTFYYVTNVDVLYVVYAHINFLVWLSVWKELRYSLGWKLALRRMFISILIAKCGVWFLSRSRVCLFILLPNIVDRCYTIWGYGPILYVLILVFSLVVLYRLLWGDIGWVPIDSKTDLTQDVEYSLKLSVWTTAILFNYMLILAVVMYIGLDIDVLDVLSKNMRRCDWETILVMYAYMF